MVVAYPSPGWRGDTAAASRARFKETIKVHTAFDHRRANFDVMLARGSDLDAAAKVMVEAVRGAERVVDDPAPTAQSTALAVNGITVLVEYWYSSSHLSDGAVTHEAIGRVDKALASAGMELAAPLVEIENVSAAAPTAEPPADSGAGRDSAESPAGDSPDTADDSSR